LDLDANFILQAIPRLDDILGLPCDGKGNDFGNLHSRHTNPIHARDPRDSIPHTPEIVRPRVLQLMFLEPQLFRDMA
jgi:hypothetical protein